MDFILPTNEVSRHAGAAQPGTGLVRCLAPWQHHAAAAPAAIAENGAVAGPGRDARAASLGRRRPRLLREITADHIHQALPSEGSARALIGSSLRSLFRVLKGRKIVFTDPTTRFRTGRPETRDPLPLELTILREALASIDPARAALAALVAFHAPRTGELQGLHLTDVRDGRLRLPERTVPLAEPVQQRITAWLDHRARRWPRTINPHLFINTYTGVRTGPVSHLWINQTIGLSAQAVRDDRILHEAIATGGDIRRLVDLFGLSVAGAERYARVVHEPVLDDTAGFGSRTDATS